MIEQLFPGGGGGGGGTVDSIQAGTGISVDATDPANPIVSSTVTDTNDAAKVSSNDTTAGYLNGKLVAGSNITFTEGNDGGNETLTIAAAGGVTGFTGSQNTASPNNTVNASRLLVDATSTNADAVLQPKGTGALLAQLPNGAASGGNKRAANAVDLQTTRDAADQVASGLRSVVLGGQKSKATGTGAIAIGDNCNAAGDDSIAIGRQCQPLANSSVAIGNQAACFASASGSFASGIDSRTYSYGQRAHGSGKFAIEGDCQYERYVQRRQTTDATQTELSCNGTAPSASSRIGIASDATYSFSALVTARRTDADNESAGYKIEGVIDNNAGTTALVGTPTVTILGEDTAAWDVVVEADNTNDALVFKVTGEAGKTIRWAATVELMKVKG